MFCYFFLESNCQIKLGVYKPHPRKAALECTIFKTASLSFLTIIINSTVLFYSKWVIFYIIINFSAICTLSSYLSFFPLRPFLCHSPPLLLLSLTAAIQESDKVQVHTHTHTPDVEVRWKALMHELETSLTSFLKNNMSSFKFQVLRVNKFTS